VTARRVNPAVESGLTHAEASNGQQTPEYGEFQTFYHGTSQEKAEAILRKGVDMEHKRTRDPGDVGWGFYLTTDLERARNCGPVVLEVVINVKTFARIPNPYFLAGLNSVKPTTPDEHLFHGIVMDEWKMRTVNGRWDDRVTAAKEVRDTFMAAGHLGIMTSHDGNETVVFDLAAIQSVVVTAVRGN